MCVIDIIRNLLTRLFERSVVQDKMDEMDGNCVGRSKEKEEDNDELYNEGSNNETDEVYVPVGQYAYYYEMKHEKRGVALIFNHQKFTQTCPERHGTNVDRDKLIKCFQDLHFDVQDFNDLEYAEIRRQIQKTTRADHSNSDCLVVVVLSHGSPNILFASDGVDYNPQDVFFDEFTADRCPTLAGKPKIFIMQACQGDALDDGIQVTQKRMTEYDGGHGYSIPTRADFLMIYATSKGHYAFRNTKDGSYFVTVLCDELLNNAAKHDLLHILTLVNQRVAVEFVSSNAKDRKYHNKKQMPHFQSYLTRFVHFGNYEQKERNPDPMIYSIKQTRKNT